MTNQDNTTQDHSDETMDMLDETLDDLADLPSTAPFAPGAHLVSLKVKRNPKKPGAYVAEMVHKAVIELSNPNTPEEAHPKEGDKSTMFINTKKKDQSVNEFGQGQLKLFLKPIGTMLGTGSINDCLAATKEGIDAIVVVGIRKGNDEYPNDQQQIIKVELAE